MSKEEKTRAAELISAAELSLELGITEATLFRWVARGVFPKPLRVGLRQYRWLKKAVDVHIETLEREENEKV